MQRVPVGEKFALVDDEDYERISKYNWTLSTGQYAICTIEGVSTFMHRLVLGLKPGDPDTDHKDNNGLNNQKSNLRRCTQSQNNVNRGLGRNNHTGFRGVVWRKDRQKWWARVMKDKKWHNAGLFENIEDAARAYDRLAKFLFGEFARLNFRDNNGT